MKRASFLSSQNAAAQNSAAQNSAAASDGLSDGAGSRSAQCSARRSGGALRPAAYGLNALFSAGAAMAVMFSMSLHPAATAAPNTAPVTPSAQAVASQTAFEQVAEQLRPSVVFVRCLRGRGASASDSDPDRKTPFRRNDSEGSDGEEDAPRFRRPGSPTAESSGSGVIIRSDGWILTNDHVVAGSERVQIRLHDGRELEGRVVQDFRSDLALIKVEATGLPVAEFADSDRVKIGQWAVAFGAPFGLSDTMTVGVVSALNRQELIGAGQEGHFYAGLIQTDASINPGNSGGPLVDIYGRIIGINVAIESPSGASAGIGFAIPAGTARFIAEQLMNKGRVTRGFLGLVPGEPTYAEKQRYGITAGAVVREMSPNAPAQRAGFHAGDLILRYNNQAVTGEAQFRGLVMRTAPGQQVAVVVKREGGEQTLTVTTEAAPETPGGAGAYRPAPKRLEPFPYDDSPYLRHGP